MAFADLLTSMEDRNALPPTRVKDLKVSLRHLARALGYQGLEDATVDDAYRDPLRWTSALEAYYRRLEAQGRDLSAVSRRNNGNNLRLVFRVAEAHGLLAAPLPQPLLTKPRRFDFQREQRATSPYQTTYHPQGPRRYGLPQAEWPPAIQAGWQAYLAHSGLRLRQTTFDTYTKAMATYLGFLLRIEGRSDVTWDDLFQVETLQAFLRWHGARLQRPISVHGKMVVIMIATIAVNQDHPNRRALADFRNDLPTITAMHNKDNHMVSLATLDEIAEACMADGRGPFQTTNRIHTPGLYRALQFQRGLILKLMRHIPIRQRNIREMQRGQNLYEAQGHWHLLFRGAGLKIAKRRGKTNEYRLDLTMYAAPFVPPLREFLKTYRPRIPGADTSPFLFLTWHGNPFTQRSLNEEVSCEVARCTGGTRFYPHLVRIMWATEYLKAHPGDYRTVAIMLGDDIGTVQRTYEHVDEALHHAKAAAFNDAVPKRG